MIHILPSEIANRIAAGEVVERPASVVRELVDNAIDAGATRIDVEIEQGGLQSIRVTDNGCGMDPQDAALCLKRHATSKIQNAEDLNRITTKGFRGEALAAISSIARLELKTRPANNEWGTRIEIEGGQEGKPQSVGTAVGTVITIRDLFYNTPARRKFLKKPATEMNHVLSTVTWNALAHENIHFTFSHNNRRTLDLPAVTSRAERIQQLFGKQVLDEMIPITLDTPALSITGFISRPTLTRNGAQQVFFFVNDRYIKDRLLLRAMLNGYRNLIHAGRYPVVFMYLEIDPTEIDINVHPTKQEIKFSHEDAVFSATYGVIRQAWDADHKPDVRQPVFEERVEELVPESKLALQRQSPVESIKNPDPIVPSDRIISEEVLAERIGSKNPIDLYPGSEKPVSEEMNKSVAIQQLNREIPPVPSASQLKSESFSSSILEKQTKALEIASSIFPPKSYEIENHASPQIFVDASADMQQSFSKPKDSFTPQIPLGALRDLIQVEKKADTLFDPRSLEESGELVVLGQFMSSYILAEGKDGLYIIDQHAAHERLLFEQFLTQSQKAPLTSQALLFPITLDFPPDEVGLVDEISGLLKSIGFTIELFGERTYVVRSIPATLEIDEAEQFIKDFLGEVRHESSASENREKALHTLACRAAVKFGDVLSHAEMEGIIRGLQKIPRRNVCPHGRPAILFVAEPALQKAFKRTGF